ncbi:integrase [Methylobacterium sp. AMS5]|nr:integrase [Methylobacterium sp. AMS5]
MRDFVRSRPVSTRWRGRACSAPTLGVPSLNGRLCDKCLNEHLFQGLPAVRTNIEAWWVDYNTCRPFTSLSRLTPNTFATQSRQDQNQNGLWL